MAEEKGGWRKSFLQRENRSPTPEYDPEAFKSSILAQDRTMLDRLEKKAAAPEERVRPAVPRRAPPAIPKPKPYRPVSDLSVVAAKVGTLDADDLCTVADALTGDASALAAAAERLDAGAAAAAPGEPAGAPEHADGEHPDVDTGALAGEETEADGEEDVKRPASPTASTMTGVTTERASQRLPPTGLARLAEQRMPLKEEKNPQPLLPESGSVFSPTDIDRFLTQMDGGEVMQGQTLLPAAGNEDRAQAVEPPPAQPSAASAKPGRSAKLSEKMQELDGLIEEDIVQRAALDRKVQAGQVAELLQPEEQPVFVDEALPTIANVFTVLEAAAKAKTSGKPCANLKVAALRAVDLAPELDIEQHVRLLRLFASCGYTDADFYLRLLGELPMLIRQANPNQLTELCSILQCLRLREETYLDLLASETMNRIRAVRRKAVPKPPAAPKPSGMKLAVRRGDSAALAAEPPFTEELVEGPFTPLQLLQIGNALALLDARPPTRFVETFQEELAIAIPLLGREDCEIASPVFFLTLLNDKLKRAFLERCAEVQAGLDVPWRSADVGSKSRLDHIGQIYLTELSVRKETFSFYASLSAEVRAYLDGLHETAPQLPRDPPSAFAAEVGRVLDQLGVQYETSARKHGALATHVLAEGTNITREQVFYECVGEEHYFAYSTTLTPAAKLRQRLFDRLGVKLSYLYVKEWSALSEAQRVNHVVKLHSYHGLDG